ncbi:MAG: SH3 domain-containing protein [Candidatus Binatia bacterium]
MLQLKGFHFLPVLLILAVLLTAGGCEKQEAREFKTTAAATEQTQPYVTTSDVNVRSGPGTQYKIITEIKRGTKVNVAGREGDWLKVVSKQGNPPGYIHERYARPGGEPTKQAVSAPAQGSYVTTAEVNVRRGPGLQYEIVAQIPRDTKVQVVDAEGDWLKVQSKHGNPPGYIEKRYAKRR